MFLKQPLDLHPIIHSRHPAIIEISSMIASPMQRNTPDNHFNQNLQSGGTNPLTSNTGKYAPNDRPVTISVHLPASKNHLDVPHFDARIQQEPFTIPRGPLLYHSTSSMTTMIS
jgi:hypothetical protein